jgi:peptide methionine sulfoxide reductase msrA/msrB
VRGNLTPEEERVMLHRGTEPPFTGEYCEHFETGTYLCRRCGARLFESGSKFHSGCGWPSFDDAIRGAVRRSPDRDGSRVEITCSACGAHLGHVFSGEGFTPKDTRHCVNSLSMVFEPAGALKEEPGTKPRYGRAVFAGGCFWGMQQHFGRHRGVLETKVGYTGGDEPDPTYELVCSGATDHAEAIEILFDPAMTSFTELARLFFEIHDPTQKDGQGPDIGRQYRSAVFFTDEAQKTEAERLVGILFGRGFRVVTEITPAGPFWPAEDYHQDYYLKTGGRSFCHVRRDRFGDSLREG